jgi:hypothetical protein
MHMSYQNEAGLYKLPKHTYNKQWKW